MTETEALTREIRILRAVIERQQRLLLNATEAAALMGISRDAFYRHRPLTPIEIPGQVEPRYSRAEIEFIADRWRTQ